LYKIASPNLTHLPLIRRTASIGKPVIMSTGMATLQQIDEAVQAFIATGNHQLCLLHCVSEYPAKPESINLRVIQTLQALYPYPIGFSDHTLEIGTSIGAVALGARAIEKHLTLDRNMKGPDHHYALEPAEFIAMTQNIRVVEAALGSGIKTVSPAERQKAQQYWRSLHAARDLPAGAVLSAEHISVVRPNDGLHPRHFEQIVGMTLRRPLKEGQPITWDMFKGQARG
ncbi:MAG: N-acetylneuraminate synthase family protein, partial [Fimbriimonas ginsengisoli]|nr:N-acetylneuraminate synthase family protein [Fimbriimonas ginsengisoli]